MIHHEAKYDRHFVVREVFEGMQLISIEPGGRKATIGVVCCNEEVDRPVQSVSTRFIEPIVRVANAAVLLVPAVVDAVDISAFAGLLDGLLLTGSRSHVAPYRYGASVDQDDAFDEERDEVALSLASRMIDLGKPVFGICRGLQEINGLFGGTLSAPSAPANHFRAASAWSPFSDRFALRHEVVLSENGHLARATGLRRLSVNSVHQQGVDRLGAGLAIEARAHDGLVEAIAARPCGGEVLAVQWHPEWDVASCAGNRAFFSLLGDAARASSPRSASIKTSYQRGH